MGEALCAIARRLFCDDMDVWPQVDSMYYLGVLLPLAVICRARNVGVSERVLIRVAQVWHIHSACLTAHLGKVQMSFV